MITITGNGKKHKTKLKSLAIKELRKGLSIAALAANIKAATDAAYS